MAVARGPGTGLTDARIETEVASQFAPVRETCDVADRRHERRGDDHVDSRHCHQPLDLGPGQRLGRDQRLNGVDLGVEELDLAQGRVDCLALGDREHLLPKPAPALDAEQVGRRRPPL